MIQGAASIRGAQSHGWANTKGPAEAVLSPADSIGTLSPRLTHHRGNTLLKPNYNFQKAERDREKQAKKEAKLREKAARKQEAKAGEAAPADDAPQPEQA